MNARYYICMGTRWVRVQLCPDGLRLAGRKSKPVLLVRDGKELHVLPSALMARELRAHAVGAPSRVRAGPSLASVRLNSRRHRYRWRRNTNRRILEPDSRKRNVQTCSVGVGTDSVDNGIMERDLTTIVGDRMPSALATTTTQNPIEGSKDALTIVADAASVISPVATSEGASVVKELVIPAEAVATLWRWAARDPVAPKLLGPVDGARFDADATYRGALLYKLQPIVRLERNAALDARLALNPLQSPLLSQHEFAALLGLVPASSPPSMLPRRRRATRFLTRRNSTADEAGSPERHKPLRDFSKLEDAAIVRWVCGSGYERRVKGNTVWQELQPRFEALTGKARSWHSLRNRYLRHILPRLDRLDLTLDVIRKLRVGAARGELHRRPPASRRNSLLARHIPVRHAHAAVTRPRLDNSPTSPKDSREVTPRNASSPASKDGPTYSAITRAFASRKATARSTSSSTTPRKVSPERPSRRLYNPGRAF